MTDDGIGRLAVLAGIAFLAAGLLASCGYDYVVATEHFDRLWWWRVAAALALLGTLSGAYLVPAKRAWWLAAAAAVASGAICAGAAILPSGVSYGTGGLVVVALVVATAAPGGRSAAIAAGAATLAGLAALLLVGANRYFVFSLAFFAIPALGAAVVAGAASGFRVRRRREREVELFKLRQDLERFGRTDELTGVPDKKQMERLARRELALARRRGVSLSVIKLDVDGLERINQQHGRSVGDEVLRAVASMCQGALRETDMIARVAGDEFVAVVMDADVAGAAALCERLRTKLKNAPLLAGDQLLKVNVTLGAATLRDGDNTVDEIIARAEQALYAERAANGGSSGGATGSSSGGNGAPGGATT